MTTSTVYCALCDKEVHVAQTPMPLHEGEANLPDAPELICLTYGRQCAGGRCPVSGLPAIVMGTRLARSDIQPDAGWRTIRMRCAGCDDLTVMEILDSAHAFCPVCRTTNRWFKVDMGDEEYLIGRPEAR